MFAICAPFTIVESGAVVLLESWRRARSLSSVNIVEARVTDGLLHGPRLAIAGGETMTIDDHPRDAGP